MKKSVFTFFAALLTINLAVANVNEFQIDEAKIISEFAEVDAIDELVSATNISFEQLVTEKPEMLTNLSANPLAPNFSFDDMDWGAFAWGFCCWPIGFFVVAINSNKDGDQKASYWIGTATATVLGLISAFSGALNNLAAR